MIATLLLIVAIVVPAMLLVWGGTRIATLLGCFAITWASSILALYLVLHGFEPDPIALAILVFLIVWPVFTIVPASIAAIRIVKPRGHFVATLGVSLLGFVTGWIVLYIAALLGSANALRLADDLTFVVVATALPALYAAIGAVYGATISARRI